MGIGVRFFFFHFSSQVYFLVPQDVRTEGDGVVACSLYLTPLHIFQGCTHEAELFCKCRVCVYILGKTGFLGSWVLSMLLLSLSFLSFSSQVSYNPKIKEKL